ncbi:hypothetical protein AB3S75_027199 [Citrus x aurantiifolia]
MAELLLSAFLDALFDRLASPDLFNFIRQLQGGVSSELRKWERKLKMIQAVLRDAEEKQLTDEAVKMWLDDLQDLACDAEDILDEFATQALEHKLMAEGLDQPGSSSKVRNLVPAACFRCFSPITTVKFNFSMRSKIKEITSRLEELCKQRIELGLQLIPGGTSSTAAAQRRPPSSSVPTEPVVFGREEDKTKILEMVLTDTAADHANFAVIPIVGMGGIGKTTLAREVYNDKAVEDSGKFDVKAWVCVSDDFDVLSISKALLESITSATCNLKTVDEVQVQLKKEVDGKRFLLVLDDVWNEDYSLWVDLKAPFLAAAPNSKMIITTRNSHVASTMGPIDHYNLEHLLDDDCWSIFKTHAFEGRDHNALEISESFRKKVVGKCGGLPLAAKTLGGLLRTTTYDMWDDILDSKIWDLPRQSSILPVLRLSYHHLPSHLKRCFAYCAIFPKDFEFDETELVFLWIAGGIIRQSSNNEQLKDLGSQCFHDLVSRSIFQRTGFGSSKFAMHDLVHDLAQLVSGETIFRLEEDNSSSRRFERVRHSSYACGELDGRNKFKVFYEIEHLRTFLPLHKTDYIITCYITSMVLYDLLPKFKKLRVLSLQGYYIGELPIPFEDLRLLRYLNLADTDIRSLPESSCSLLNLEILILRNCSSLIKLPSKIRSLINLCHLDIRGAILLKEMPFGMKELKNLQTLSNFVVGKGGETASGLEDLKFLKFLSGELCISGLQNVNDSKNAREAALCEKLNLEALSLEWGSQFDNSRDEVAEEQVLGVLQPHKFVKELTIKRYGGARFPLWIGDPLFSKMNVLELDNCWNCTSLPSLGLLSSLRDLTIKRMTNLKSIGCELFGKGFSKPFQSLEILSFEYLSEWEHWDTDVDRNEHVEIFPRLQKLSIVECPELSGKVPELLPSLKTLVVSKCQKLKVSLSSYPMLCRLEADECKELVCRTPIDSKLIKSMTISNSSLDINGCEGMLHASRTSSSLLQTETISNALEFGKLFKPEFQVLETLIVGNSRELKSWRPYGGFRMLFKPPEELIMFACPDEVSIEESCISLVSFPEISFFPRNLRYLIISEISTLRSLPEEFVDNNSQLETLYIGYCDSLKFVTKGKLPSSLKSLQIENCKNLQHLVDGEHDASAVASSSSFFISYCHSLTFVARQKLPSCIKSLEINCCKNLQCLVDDEEDAPSSSLSSVTLESLQIRDCPQLTCLSSGIHLLEALEDLHIRNCPKLESIPEGLHKLRSIYIKKCPSLVSLAEKGLPNTISHVTISYFEKLDALPNGMHKLQSLQYLKIKECPSILSFSEEGFPTNLKLIRIGGGVDAKMYKAVIQWGLHRLTSLIGLSIEECHDAESFPDEEMRMMLPASLTFLILRGLSKLKYLSSMGFQSLTSLEHLLIEDCPNLTSFPEVGLPSSLLSLEIKNCPKLRKQCKRDRGKEWSKIARIPCVKIDDKLIYDPEAE